MPVVITWLKKQFVRIEKTAIMAAVNGGRSWKSLKISFLPPSFPRFGERASRLNAVPNAGAKSAEFVSECAAGTRHTLRFHHLWGNFEKAARCLKMNPPADVWITTLEFRWIQVWPVSAGPDKYIYIYIRRSGTKQPFSVCSLLALVTDKC